MLTGGAAPPPSVMRQMEEELGIRPLSAYGLTEVRWHAVTRADQKEF
ncbi:unnamed protein product, partial [Scytosiphon promiscuus]